MVLWIGFSTKDKHISAIFLQDTSRDCLQFTDPLLESRSWTIYHLTMTAPGFMTLTSYPSLLNQAGFCWMKWHQKQHSEKLNSNETRPSKDKETL